MACPIRWTAPHRGAARDGDEPSYFRWWQHFTRKADFDDRCGKVITELGRDDLLTLYAHAIPTRTALEHLLRLGPLIEVGAGAGYWARLLRDLDADVLAYDEHPPERNHWLTGAVPGHPAAVAPNWTTVQTGDHTLVAQHPGRALFVCWPPRPGTEYLSDILRRTDRPRSPSSPGPWATQAPGTSTPRWPTAGGRAN
ncbi:hypothetical protein Sru01_30210 [Sphaerisporangium rufum]|uniref:Uncharacterized protein n=1 Tax=Sphaerisporangium rufum TaxID=1381558 RepID=A0A919R1J0_9ACTN|nr:hypothetical protein [Sphaerisporangium rufum]GII78039.1 hypothetical protein Sru01_30210 [Sphaerisporangium rufum]